MMMSPSPLPPHSPARVCKLVRVITRLNIGGPAIHTVFLTRALAEAGYPTTLATGVCETADGDMSYLLAPNDSVSWIPEMSRSVSPLKNLRALLRLWRLMRAERPQIVHTHTAMAGSLGRTAAILARVPVIVHTFHGNSLRQYFSPVASAIFLAIERLLALGTDAICVISPQQLHELSSELRIAPARKFRLVPLGLDLTPCLDLSPPAPSEPIRVGWFGRLVDVKNIGLLLETVYSAKKSEHRFEFHVAGDGPDRHLIEEALPRLAPQLVWHGWKHDIVPVLAACDIVIQTSRNEGTPVALIQGMAAARPFLSTAAGGVVDMTSGKAVNLTGGATWFDNGVLVEPNAAAFVRALEQFARYPERITGMGQSARAFASAGYRQEALISNLDSLYRELLARKLPHLDTVRHTVSTQS
jgi:glycosyltransferase involved in cell wall biosynthesis